MAMLNNQRVIHHIPIITHDFLGDVDQCLPISWAFGGSKDARNVPKLNGFAYMSLDLNDSIYISHSDHQTSERLRAPTLDIC